MRIESQVCVLEQAKRLKELGVVQDKSAFTWCVIMPDPIGESWFYAPVYCSENLETILHETVAAAFTVAELGIMIHDSSIMSYKGIGEASVCAFFKYETPDKLEMKNWVAGSSEAEARAAVLIHLLETGAVTADQVNQRLAE